MIRIWCEYEYGQEDVIFDTEETAQKWLDNVINNTEDAEWVLENQCSAAELIEDGLVRFELVTYIKNIS